MKKSLQYVLLIIVFSFSIAYANEKTAVAPLNLEKTFQNGDFYTDSFSVAISGGNLIVGLTTFTAIEVNASLMSIVGQKVEQWKWEWDSSGKQNKKLSLENIPSGIYIFTVKIGDKNFSRKLII